MAFMLMMGQESRILSRELATTEVLGRFSRWCIGCVSGTYMVLTMVVVVVVAMGG